MGEEMKMWILTVEKDYKITLPKGLMEHLGWRAGDTLLFKGLSNGVIEVSRVKRAKSLNSRRLPLPNVGIDK